MSTHSVMASACVVLAMACSSEPKRPARDAREVSSPRSEERDEARAVQAQRNDPPAVADREPAVGDLPPVEGEQLAGPEPVSADGTNAADNTGINERDRGGELTPLDQGNSSDETEITAAIRKEIMADDSLSFSAKNVKVITVGSKVTLRGPVASKAERSRIESLAKTTSGVSRVDNQLEIKP